MITLHAERFEDQVRGCWLGKNIGGTLGGPFEGRREILDVKGYTTPAGSPLPNDDLDLQLVWLKAVIEHGAGRINAALLSEYWIDCIPAPFGEYGVCKMNLRAGLLPPLSGSVHNPILQHSNGAWIRSEIWACLLPACPDAALRLAYEDASVDHGAGEGMVAALFTTAVESAAFVLSDPRELLGIGLSKIPAQSYVARAVRIALAAYDEGIPWQEARERVVQDSVPELGWFQAPANIGFFVIGWLWGEGDFGKSLLVATNCGDDTDCTAATLGAILGIIHGARKIPREWTEPIGDQIVTVAIDRSKGQSFWPATLSRLTELTLRETPKALAALGAGVELSSSPTALPPPEELGFDSPTIAHDLCARSAFAVRVETPSAFLTLDYQRAPILRPGEPFPVLVDIENRCADHSQFEITWHLPPGLRVLEGRSTSVFRLLRWYEGVLMRRGKGAPRAPERFTLLADATLETTVRGVLEVRPQGRPNATFLPVVFLNEAPGERPL